jgi:hypothetical protein
MDDHNCDAECVCRLDLDAAAVRLAEASRLLSNSILPGSDELIEVYYASFRAAKAKFCGARAAYIDHRLNQADVCVA